MTDATHRGSSPSLRDLVQDETLALGTAGLIFGALSDAEAVDVIRTGLGVGIRIVDTARAYTRAGEESSAETLVRRALADGESAGVIVMTKGGHDRQGDEFPVDGRPETIRRHCRRSLRALGRERLDVYLLHHPDPHVDIEESVGALEALRTEGLVRWIGVSNVSADQLDRSLAAGRIDAVQNRLSLTHPTDLAFAQACVRRDIAYFAHSPLGGSRAPTNEAAARIAREHGVSEARVRLGWLRARAPEIIPVVGATRPVTVSDAAGPTVALGHDELDALERDGSHPAGGIG